MKYAFFPGCVLESAAVPVIDWKPQSSSGYGEGKKKTDCRK